MTTKPDYRFVCQIVDRETDEVVIRGTTFLSAISEDGECESVDTETGSVLRAFQKKAQREYEELYYSTN